MPHYFFDIYSDGKLAPDEFGLELESFDEARDQAISILPDIARDELPDGEKHDFVCEVRAAEGQMVYRAMLMYRGERLDGAAASSR